MPSVLSPSVCLSACLPVCLSACLPAVRSALAFTCAANVIGRCLLLYCTVLYCILPQTSTQACLSEAAFTASVNIRFLPHGWTILYFTVL